MADVALEDIRKSYDSTEVIKGVDLRIRDGEFLVLVGPSGCGKSTLLRLVAGLEEITAGTLRIGDETVNDVAPRDRGVAMVFQSYALYPHMTVRGNMAFGLEIRKTPRDEIDERIADASQMLGIDALLDRQPKQLSGGQRQRVAIGRAIVRQPDVFLFDEPLSNLDAALRTQMRVELKKLHQRLETTMLYVTHDQVEAMTLADRIAVVHEGLIQQVGTPAEVYESPANRFVASFIGSPSMNFLTGDVSEGRMRADGLDVPLEHDGVAEIGIRPQHLDLEDDDADAGADVAHVEGRVDVVEPMGWEVYVHAHAGEQPLVAHLRAEQVGNIEPGDTLDFVVEPTRVHAFGADGARLSG